MAKKFMKPKSKRLTCHKKFKIQKKIREHHRKVRKEAKKNAGKRPKRDPGVPNSLPFKEQVLDEVQDLKQQLADHRRELSLAGMVLSAQKRSKSFTKTGNTDDPTYCKIENSRTYYREFRKVIAEADVVVEVLDARDPLGTRCFEVEEEVVTANKKLVLLLNKIDLVPKSNVEAWLAFLRRSHPTLAFKANTQEQQDRLGRSQVKWQKASEKLYKSSTSLGADGLLKMLGSYSRVSSAKGATGPVGALSVGVVGLPNTGKSAVINTLKRSKVCPSSNLAGLTKHCQEITLDKSIKLLDSPGIVLSKTTDEKELVLRNCIRVENLSDPVPAVEAVLRRCPKKQIMLRYNVCDFTDTNDFLVQLASRMGRLKKGGIPDVTQAARRVLQDWIQGRITYYTLPPEMPESSDAAPTAILTEFSPEFKLVDVDAEVLGSLTEQCGEGVALPASKPMAMGTGESEAEEEEMSEDDEEVSGDEEEVSGDEEEMVADEKDEEEESVDEDEDIDDVPEEEEEVEEVQKIIVEKPKSKQKKFRTEEPRKDILRGLRLNRENKLQAKKFRKQANKTNKKLADNLTKMMSL